MGMKKKALITGVAGQDGAYLSALLLEKGYEVYGTYRRSANFSSWRLQELGVENRVQLVEMELLEFSNILSVLRHVKPDEIYNLAAQSFVASSFETPIYTTDVDGLGPIRLLEAIRSTNPKTRFYQASTSEMFGKAQTIPQTETTPFYPRSPYGIAKLAAHWMTVNYREAYNLYACSGILFNHESPLRGMEFVTRKITAAFAAIHRDTGGAAELGNLDAQRDWGFAGDYVEGMWLMLQQGKPDDYVLATGATTTIRRFAELAAQALDVDLVWKGTGEDEVGVDRKTGKVWVKINPHYYRPAEVDFLIGDSSKATAELGWRHKVSLEELVEMMIEADLRRFAGKTAAARRAMTA
jgi:GDPmannose 4,6-dehydratase